ncbi:MAG: hypothetical protein KKH93_00285 [Candidatus Omnitrophica bacterium]|nr:hypothetical protein [Candidatus Omnitrophota bacterium]MBU2043831.1 hypothetical protein [Candidatus Omnitrophota bacterium]MBU2251770.1 hypothetical protein [Candidatus Omnitrophota bacterium]MBU2265431.1 hypothetical protein [Candidatus Omnitrophota bacterium]MBU2473169.1 hypothetical protein [Candidatus Omnitrophota bacterium]
MSIIYEALKKVEQKENSNNSYRDSKENFSSAKPKKRTVFLSGRFFRMFMLLILTAGLISVVSFNWQFILGKVFSLSSLARKEYLINQQGRQTAKIAQSENSATTQRKPGAYLLSGIIYSEDSPLAIINGQVLKQSDRIGNYSVMAISQDRVELAEVNDNSQLILSLSSFE